MKKWRFINKEDVERNLINLKRLVFEVTDACNLRCKYCGYADLYEDMINVKAFSSPFNEQN